MNNKICQIDHIIGTILNGISIPIQCIFIICLVSACFFPIDFSGSGIKKHVKSKNHPLNKILIVLIKN